MIETGVRTMSALKWVEFCEEQGLLQLVKTGTRGEHILDCIFSNSPYTRKINIEVNTQLTDHGTVIMDYIMTNTGGNKAERTSPFWTKINDYKLDSMDDSQKAKLREKLWELLEGEKDNFEEMSVEELQELIINSYETAVSESASPRRNQNRKARPPKAVRKYNNIRKRVPGNCVIRY